MKKKQKPLKKRTKRITYREFYHLSPSENKKTIEQNGICVDEKGQIFVFSDMKVANTIARSQVFARKYVVFEIDPKGIEGEIEQDEVAEFSHVYQWIILQKKIAPEFLKLIGEYEVQQKTDYDYETYERFLGFKRKQAEELFSIQEKSQNDEIDLDEANKMLQRLMRKVSEKTGKASTWVKTKTS